MKKKILSILPVLLIIGSIFSRGTDKKIKFYDYHEDYKLFEINKLEKIRNSNIAIIDGGLERSRVKLYGDRVKHSINYSGYADPHGVQITSLALGSENESFFGFCNVCNVFSYGVFEDGKANNDYVVDAINDAIYRGVDIINLSIGSRQFSEQIKNALEDAFANDIIIFAAAGNSGDQNVLFPAASQYTYQVSALKEFGVAWTSTTYNEESLWAIGHNVAVETGNDKDGYGVDMVSGTSYSTAIMSGYIGNLIARSSLTTLEIRDRLDRIKNNKSTGIVEVIWEGLLT